MWLGKQTTCVNGAKRFCHLATVVPLIYETLRLPRYCYFDHQGSRKSRQQRLQTLTSEPAHLSTRQISPLALHSRSLIGSHLGEEMVLSREHSFSNCLGAVQDLSPVEQGADVDDGHNRRVDAADHNYFGNLCDGPSTDKEEEWIRRMPSK